MPDVAGKVAVITGASRGLGAALAESFAKQGMRLGLCSRGEPALASGDDVIAEKLDVRDEDAVDAFAAKVEERFGDIHLWINNAGVLEPMSPVRDTAVDDFRHHIEVNLIGVFLCTRAYARHVRRRGSEGVLVNISSGAARHPYAGLAAYCAGKAAVDRLADCVQLEEEDAGLRVYSVAPGVIDTDMQEKIRAASPEVLPSSERFWEMKRENTFNTTGFVAEHMLALAFDPQARPEEVCCAFPDEVPH